MIHNLLPFLYRLSPPHRPLLHILQKSHSKLIILTRYPALFPNAATGLYKLKAPVRLTQFFIQHSHLAQVLGVELEGTRYTSAR